ncbi:MAG: hypothetical protein HY738_19315 [Bacteroidia bacterium]|nr:hypothetical protein [Bacteroidia bacterium]
MIRKYHSFLEARLDLYREMWERGFDEKRISKLFNELKASYKRNNLLKFLYNPGIYFFKTIEESQKDMEKRIFLKKDYDNT